MELSDRGARFLLGLMLVLGVLSFLVVRPLLQYVALALVVAFLLRNLQASLVRATRRPRLAASLLVLLTLVLLVAPVAMLAVMLAQQVQQLTSILQDESLVTRAIEVLAGWGMPEARVRGIFDALLAGARQTAAGSARRALPTLFEFFLGFFVFLFLLFYVLHQGQALVGFVRRAIPLTEERMDRLLGESARAVDAVFKGEILVALVQGLVAGIGWWLFGYPDPVLWGFVATLLSIIPWTGAAIVIVPFGVWSILQGDVVRGASFIAFGVVLVGSIDNVLRPILIGRAGEIHPALVLLGVVGGLSAFGLAGLFIGPLVLTLLRVTIVVWREGAPPAAVGPRLT